tara:strand:- start:48 stop:779 length:732 start_codon:yes stop_codon:yes gene_type:complete
MPSKNSKSLNFIKKFPIFKRLYFFYNIYIRNYKFYFSGSQFNEDKKILKLFNKNFKGSYLDVGCYHPTRVNNTLRMFRGGWSGMNIDLNELTIDLFNYARPNDINICSAVSNKSTKKKLYFLGQLDPKNTLDSNHKKWLNKHFNISNKDIKTKIIRTRKLGDILDENKFYNIDFMNIDIEGHEIEVLKSLNFKKFKIKVICIEILSYDVFTSKRKKLLISYLKKNKYTLKAKSTVNYIFKRKN